LHNGLNSQKGKARFIRRYKRETHITVDNNYLLYVYLNAELYFKICKWFYYILYEQKTHKWFKNIDIVIYTRPN